MGGELGGTKTAKSEPNVVPLCDVLLVLLIIFMVVTPMIQKGANVTLPEARYTEDLPEPGQLLTVNVRKTGETYLDDKLVEDLSKLGQMILDRMEELQKTEKKVLLRADLEVEYGRLVDVMNAIRDAQIEVVGLVTEKKTSGVE